MHDDEQQRFAFASDLIAEAGAVALEYFGRVSSLAVNSKGLQDVVTEADVAVENLIKDRLADRYPSDAFLGEETGHADFPGSTGIWVVDPIDGTQEFVQGIPEWCVSIGLVEDGIAVAGGVMNPATGETVLGAVGQGVTLNGVPVARTRRAGLDGALVLASRSEVTRGEWARFAGAPFTVRACGSVAYKLALVAAGLADATWTLVPKSEWDVAGGAALMRAAGGSVLHADGSEPRFNRADPRLPDFLAGSSELLADVRATWLTGPR